MKRRTKRKIKKALSKNIVLVLFISLFFSIFLLGTAYSLMSGELELKGSARIDGIIKPDEDRVCSTIVRASNLRQDWDNRYNIDVTVTNNSEEKMNDIIIIFDKIGLDIDISNVSWANVTFDKEVYYLNIVTWYINQNTGNNYLSPGESITMVLTFTGNITESQISERIYTGNCGQDNDTNNSETEKITNGNAEINLGILEKELPITATITGFSEWENTYQYSYTITNIYDVPIDNFRFVIAYNEYFTFTGLWDYTDNVTDDATNHVLKGAYSNRVLNPGESFTFYTTFKRSIGEPLYHPNPDGDGGWYGGYQQEDISIDVLAAGVIK